MRIPGQVLRIAVVFALAIAVLVAARQRFVPDSFGEIGHYRAAALPAIAAQPVRYAGTQACVECHSEEGEIKARSYHSGLACESCHGPAAEHAADPEKGKPHLPRERAFCVRCHGYQQARPTGFPQILEAVHNPLQPCTTCHQPHDPRPPRVPESCSGCHGAIARTKAVSHHHALECETCHQTPREHRTAPRLHRPRKPAAREFCGQCHAAGASSPKEIPRVDLASHGGRYLCWQCHYPHDPEGRP